MKKFTPLLAILVLLCLLSACGDIAMPEPSPSPSPAPTAEPTPVPTPEPTPTPEPELPFGGSVAVEGLMLPSGSVLVEGVRYVSLEEFLAAEGNADSWFGEAVSASEGDDIITVGTEPRELSGEIVSYHAALWCPVEGLCDALGVSLTGDGETDMLYCTSAAGEWDVPAGYTVPVIMYHGVTDDTWGIAELFVSPADMDASIAWLLDNGYEPIWFSDLRHVQDYAKPVILTFDDGYTDNYEHLFPILQKYQVKATCFIITSSVPDDPKTMTAEQIREMSASGLVDIQSHTYSHSELSSLSYEEQEREMKTSKADILRLTGKEPYVVCYPSGKYDNGTKQLAMQYYRFGITTDNACFITGNDPAAVPRYRVNRSGGANTLIYLMKNTVYRKE